MPQAGLMRIGQVSERTGLSLHTIRYYDEAGLVEPSAHSRGGFRLYTETDVEQIDLVKRMKPLDFGLEEIRELLTILDQLHSPASTPGLCRTLNERLDTFEAAVADRCCALRQQLAMAEEFADRLHGQRTRTDARTCTPIDKE